MQSNQKVTVKTPAKAVTAEIRAEMARQNMPIGKLSQLSGINRVTLSRKLNDARDISIDELFAVSSVVMVGASEFIGRAESQIRKHQSESPPSSYENKPHADLRDDEDAPQWLRHLGACEACRSLDDARLHLERIESTQKAI